MPVSHLFDTRLRGLPHAVLSTACALLALVRPLPPGAPGAPGDVERLRVGLVRWEAAAGLEGWSGDDVWRFVAHHSQGALLAANTS